MRSEIHTVFEQVFRQAPTMNTTSRKKLFYDINIGNPFLSGAATLLPGLLVSLVSFRKQTACRLKPVQR